MGIVKLGDVEVSISGTLMDLKNAIFTQCLEAREGLVMPEKLRIRTMDSKRHVCLVLRDNSQTLKRCKLSSGANVSVQLLPKIEDLSPTANVIWVAPRLTGSGYQAYRRGGGEHGDGGERMEETVCPDAEASGGQRGYGKPVQIVFDGGSTPKLDALRQRAAEALGLPAANLEVAKRMSDSDTWLVVEDDSCDKASAEEGAGQQGSVPVLNEDDGQYTEVPFSNPKAPNEHAKADKEEGAKKKKTKKKAEKTHLKQRPVNLADGDLFGVRDVTTEGGVADDFETEWDALLRAKKDSKDKKPKAVARPEVAFTMSVRGRISSNQESSVNPGKNDDVPPETIDAVGSVPDLQADGRERSPSLVLAEELGVTKEEARMFLNENEAASNTFSSSR